jgi:divalent metal cation (Fe/Co/Zn/Cd) transporter
MKDIVIGTLDILSSALVFVAIVAFIILTFSMGLYGAGLGIAIFIATCFVCGFWMALSKIIENQERLIIINSKMLDGASKSERVNDLIIKKNEDEVKVKVVEDNLRQRAERKAIHKVRCSSCGDLIDASKDCPVCGVT